MKTVLLLVQSPCSWQLFNTKFSGNKLEATASMCGIKTTLLAKVAQHKIGRIQGKLDQKVGFCFKRLPPKQRSDNFMSCGNKIWRLQELCRTIKFSSRKPSHPYSYKSAYKHAFKNLELSFVCFNLLFFIVWIPMFPVVQNFLNFFAFVTS